MSSDEEPWSSWSHVRALLRPLILLHVSASGAEDDSQADPDGEADREGPLRGGVDGQVEGREGGRQSLLHH